MKMLLSEEQEAVIAHREGHLQVIACAGSGKTESMARLVAGRIAEGLEPESIIAFTFTERAAEELKERIAQRVSDRLGEEAKGSLARMFVGTIHGYCFRMLQEHVPSMGNYDVLDEHRHAGLLSREHFRLGLKRLGYDKHWEPIRDFMDTVDVIGNELVRPDQLAGTPLGEVYGDYLATLDRYHYLTFALVIQRAVEALDDPRVRKAVHGKLRFLVVDEYQDINPAQEALIRKLGRHPVQVCVVGDDDQAIYQWRGSDVLKIQDFRKTFAGAKSLPLSTNRRSRPEIIEIADRLAKTITHRLPKSMGSQRKEAPLSVVPWSAETPEEEAETIGIAIEDLSRRGTSYRDIAVLFRSVRTSAEPLIRQLTKRDVPFACGGRTGLFLQPVVEVLGRTYLWFVDREWWPPGYGQQGFMDTAVRLAKAYRAAFGPVLPEKEIVGLLEDWKRLVPDLKRPVNLIRDYYEFLHHLGVHDGDLDDRAISARLGALARFSNILADFENVTRRGRWQEKEGVREFTGGQDRGLKYYERLSSYVQHYARDAYEEFEGEPAPDLDAVDILTVHQAKGLEWPVVFLPALVDRRFPSTNTGKARTWLLPDKVLSAKTQSRYEGTEDDERRLFYVAITRARDTLYLSHFRRQKNRAKKSRFLTDLFGDDSLPAVSQLKVLPSPGADREVEVPKLSVSFSELSDYDECGYRFRLSSSLGFETQLVPELGYGRAIHHVLRHVAETARDTGKVPSTEQLEGMMDKEFYLPFANKANFPNMRAMASRLVSRYVTSWKEDLSKIWATERAFELHLQEGTLSGRADVILDRHEGRPDALAIVDYKTTKGKERDPLFEFQLKVYVAAGRAEGLNVEAAFLHHLEESQRTAVDVSAKSTGQAVEKVNGLVRDLRARKFVPKPSESTCKPCEYRRLCKHAQADEWEA